MAGSGGPEPQDALFRCADPPVSFDDPEDLLSFDPVRRQRDWRDERPWEVRRLDTTPIDWQERIDAAIESEDATTYEVMAHAIADMTVEHERQIAELKREVKADHTAMGLQQFSDKLHRTLAQCTGAYRSTRSRSDRTPEPPVGHPTRTDFVRTLPHFLNDPQQSLLGPGRKVRSGWLAEWPLSRPLHKKTDMAADCITCSRRATTARQSRSGAPSGK